MIADHETNVVFVADTLEREFPAVYSGLKEILGRHDIPLRTIPGTRSIWCRDYMPIQVSEDRFVQFRYAPDYLTGKYRHLRADGQIGSALPWIKECVLSEIVLDGGNVVRWDDQVLMTEKVFDENPGWERRDLISRLVSLLEIDRLILIPTEPGDWIGHSDGVLRFLSREVVVMNDYRSEYREYGKEIRRRLENAKWRGIAFPYRPVKGNRDLIPSAVGNYVNFLRVGSLIVLPCFGINEDAAALTMLKTEFEGFVAELACRDLAAEGGVLNCCTWTIKRTSSSKASDGRQGDWSGQDGLKF